jgi:hypothetical protein
MGSSREEDTRTVVSSDGLRYATKAPGSPYFASGTMSCLLCGRHVPKRALEVFAVAGTKQNRCSDHAGCKQSREASRRRT